MKPALSHAPHLHMHTDQPPTDLAFNSPLFINYDNHLAIYLINNPDIGQLLVIIHKDYNLE